jgi:glycosyltransferase involved in cell wall biosynthesis
MSALARPLRIAQVAPPIERVPPIGYGGTERVVHELTSQLVRRGHTVTVFASGDSDVPAELVPTIDRALRPAGIGGDPSPWFMATIHDVLDRASEFDLIHSHLEWWSTVLGRVSPVPVVATYHGRLDQPYAERLFDDADGGLIAISRSQAAVHPNLPWTVIHNGLTLDRAPFVEQPGEDLCFVGRVDPEKGIVEAMDLATALGRRLRIAAKIGTQPDQVAYYEEVFKPALERAGRSVEFLGEIQAGERDELFAHSYATLMPGAWPEPFGLVAIESMACGTPILARRVGALPEIIRDGVDGFFGDDVAALAFQAERIGGLDRRAIRDRVIDQFSASRMTDRYEELYARTLGLSPADDDAEPAPDTDRAERRVATERLEDARGAAARPTGRLARPVIARSSRGPRGPRGWGSQRSRPAS